MKKFFHFSVKAAWATVFPFYYLSRESIHHRKYGYFKNNLLKFSKTNCKYSTNVVKYV